MSVGGGFGGPTSIRVASTFGHISYTSHSTPVTASAAAWIPGSVAAFGIEAATAKLTDPTGTEHCPDKSHEVTGLGEIVNFLREMIHPV
jgi:hypothetical protein